LRPEATTHQQKSAHNQGFLPAFHDFHLPDFFIFYLREPAKSQGKNLE